MENYQKKDQDGINSPIDKTKPNKDSEGYLNLVTWNNF
jgi:hypothetical protein